MLIFVGSQELIRVNNKREFLEVRSSIEEPRTPISGLIYTLALSGTVVNWFSLPEIGQITTVFWYCSLQSAVFRYRLVFRCTIDNINNFVFIVVTRDAWFVRQNNIYTKKQKIFLFLHQNTASIVNKWHFNKTRKYMCI